MTKTPMITPNTPSQPLENTPLLTPVINTLLTGVIIADDNFRCVYMNTAAEQILSISQLNLINADIIELLTPIHHDTNASPAPAPNAQARENAKNTLIQQFANTKKMHQTFIHHNCTILGLSKKEYSAPILVDFGVSALETATGFYYLVEMWAKDTESRIQQEQYLHDQHHTTRQLIRNMAHEVKNPLAGILGASQLLEKNFQQLLQADNSRTMRTADNLEKKTKKIATYLQIIMDETRRLNNLVTQLLGTPSLPHWQRLNIHEPLQHALTLTELQHPHIRLCRDYDLSLPEITADKDQLIQVFINILNNATQALNENCINQPKITVRSRIHHQQTIGEIRHKSVLRIDIIDNGTGIDSQLLPKIFYPLVTGRDQGTGLGLALVQDIVQRHGGLVTVNSQVGETVFSIFLPWQSTANHWLSLVAIGMILNI